MQRVLLTAEEAFPALEDLFDGATQTIWLGFRIFDPGTRLHGAGRAGSIWFDLIADTLARGVTINVILSDFDPIVRPELHRYVWSCARRWIAAAEASGRPDKLKLHVALHPARLGLLPRIALWPRVRKELKQAVEGLNDGSVTEQRDKFLRSPGLRPYLRGAPGELQIINSKMPTLAPVSHHQKIAVFDGRTVYVGGLDVNDRRFDTPDHDRPAGETWHDVQVIESGAVAAEAEAHLATLSDVVAGHRAPPPAQDLLRTLSAKRRNPIFSMSPEPLRDEIAEATRDGVRGARDLIYLESQFFRDRQMADVLVSAAKAQPDLRLLLVLPAAPEDAAFDGSSSRDVRYGEYLQAKFTSRVARAFGDRCFVMSPAQPRRPDKDENGRAALHGSPIIYLHAKVSIFDDDLAIISSANLNGRSARWDTEAGITLSDHDGVVALRRRCFEHWLNDAANPSLLDPDHVVGRWRDLASRNVSRRAEDREGFVLPYPIRAAKRFGRNLPVVPEEMV